jgi:two-component system, CitB family, response regulator DctR
MNDAKKILIIEDDKALQDVYKLVLSHTGYEVYTANNGAEGLVINRRIKPDLILLDIFMPVLDGKEFLKRFDRKKYPDTRIIVYSNLSDRETQQYVSEHGANKYIIKSDYSPQDLIKLVKKQLKLKESKKSSKQIQHS